MASLVLVSHSAALARAARELAEQMAGGRVRIVDVGGLDERTLGTSAERIREALAAVAALTSADDPGGVLVLVDMGSALYSTDVALELLPPEQRARVTVSDAPLVEGAVVAAAQLAAGASREEAAAEARRALDAKRAHLGAQPAAPRAASSPSGEAGEEIIVTIPNALGLHARPAAQVVNVVSGSLTSVILKNLSRDAPPARADSMSALALLDARRGDRVAIWANGPEARPALEALRELIAGGFGEIDEPPLRAAGAIGAVGSRPEAPPAGAATVLTGIAAAPGIAIGPASVLRQTPSIAEEPPSAGAEIELSRLRHAVERACEELRALRARIAAQVGEHDAAIFDAHIAFLRDPALLSAVEGRVREEALGAAAAWRAELTALAARCEASPNHVLSARAADLRDVGERVLAQLGPRGREARRAPPGLPAPHDGDAPSILVAEELSPSEAASLDPARTLAVCMARGAPTSHSVILARGLGVPAVVGLGDALLAVPDGASLLVDGDAGQVLVAPGAPAQTAYAERERASRERRAAAQGARGEPAITRDGRRVPVLANASSAAEARAALSQGAEGVGLVRTELLYFNRELPPDEEEQLAAYRALLEALGPRPLVVRTFDIGGDKPAPCLGTLAEPNPSLGLRGLRLSLARPALLRAQLRAVLRAAAGGVARVMFPMVTTEEELRRASTALDEVRAELSGEGVAQAERVERGIMIEVPAAALLADALVRRVDFISVGTNDLAQYTLAADRANAETAPLADALHPAVLLLIERATRAARAHGKRTTVCGELAGDPQAVPLLLGLGVDELSVSVAAVAAVKAAVRGVALGEARALARRALALESAAAVRRLLAG